MSEHSPETNGNGVVESVLPGESATARAAHASLKGDRKGLARLWPFLGPAFIAAVAYVDPGNFATNIAGGARSASERTVSSRYDLIYKENVRGFLYAVQSFLKVLNQNRSRQCLPEHVGNSVFVFDGDDTVESAGFLHL